MDYWGQDMIGLAEDFSNSKESEPLVSVSEYRDIFGDPLLVDETLSSSNSHSLSGFDDSFSFSASPMKYGSERGARSTKDEEHHIKKEEKEGIAMSHEEILWNAFKNALPAIPMERVSRSPDDSLPALFIYYPLPFENNSEPVAQSRQPAPFPITLLPNPPENKSPHRHSPYQNGVKRLRASGEWCHQCKQKHIDVLCCTGSCTKKYCRRCLKNHYDLNFSSLTTFTWLCPCCRNQCSCPRCRQVPPKTPQSPKKLSKDNDGRDDDDYVDASELRGSGKKKALVRQRSESDNENISPSSSSKRPRINEMKSSPFGNLSALHPPPTVFAAIEPLLPLLSQPDVQCFFIDNIPEPQIPVIQNVDTMKCLDFTGHEGDDDFMDSDIKSITPPVESMTSLPPPPPPPPPPPSPTPTTTTTPTYRDSFLYRKRIGQKRMIRVKFEDLLKK
jgi:hypothetical protein